MSGAERAAGPSDVAVGCAFDSWPADAASSIGARPNQLRRASDDCPLRWVGASESEGEVKSGCSGPEAEVEARSKLRELDLWMEGEREGRSVEAEVLDWSGRVSDLVEVEADEMDAARSGFFFMLGMRSSAVVVDSVG